MDIKISDLDRLRFGLPIAKIKLGENDNIDNISNWCFNHKIKLLITRCATRYIKKVQELEFNGYFITDTLIYYKSRSLNKKNEALQVGYSWRTACINDAEEVRALAATIFKNYSGHYHADPRLEKDKSDLVYSSWAENSCLDRNYADDILLILFKNKIVAFLTIKINESTTCEILLNGVDPCHQGRGLYNSLFHLAVNWAVEKGMVSVLVSTQITNVAVQKVWCRHCFEPTNSFYTFHKWF